MSSSRYPTKITDEVMTNEELEKATYHYYWLDSGVNQSEITFADLSDFVDDPYRFALEVSEEGGAEIETDYGQVPSWVCLANRSNMKSFIPNPTPRHKWYGQLEGMAKRYGIKWLTANQIAADSVHKLWPGPYDEKTRIIGQLFAVRFLAHLPTLTPSPASQLWDKLGDIPIDQDECIEEKFLHFEIGTFREDIWHWFEDAFDITLGTWAAGEK